jgi:hypothetical protein
MTAHRYESELSERAMRRARRRVMAEPEPEVPWDPRMPIVRLANVVLAVGFLYAVLAVWVLSLLKDVTL